MKVYEVVFEEGDQEGIYALSVVEDPAMQDFWIALSEHPKTIELAQVDEEKRLLLGAALIPNKKILRRSGEDEFYITFTEQTIEKLAHNFFKNGYQNNSSLEHQIKLDGMSVVEGWTVENPRNDKSNNFGKEYPKGTFVTMMKVDNDEVWGKVKSGEIKGFSIDAFLGLQEINLNTDKMDLTSITNAIKDGFTALMNNAEESKEEVQDPKENEVVEVKDAEIKDLSTDALKEAISEGVGQILAQFTKEQDEKFEALKVELSKSEDDTKEKLEAKEQEIEDLKVELDKKPEVEPIKAKPETEDKKVELNNNPALDSRTRATKNIAKAMGW